MNGKGDIHTGFICDALMEASMRMHAAEAEGADLSDRLEFLWSQITDYLEWSKKTEQPQVVFKEM